MKLTQIQYQHPQKSSIYFIYWHKMNSKLIILWFKWDIPNLYTKMLLYPIELYIANMSLYSVFSENQLRIHQTY